MPDNTGLGYIYYIFILPLVCYLVKHYIEEEMSNDSIAKILEDWNTPVKLSGRSHNLGPKFYSLNELYGYLERRVKRQGKTTRFTELHPYEHLQGRVVSDSFSINQKRRAIATRSKEIEFLKRIREYKKTNRKVA